MAPNVRQQRRRSARRSKPTAPAIQEYIPSYLQRYVTPYHGDFCFTPIFHHRLITQLMAEGFLPIATEGMMLPKLHANRCVVRLPDNLHVSKSTRKKSKRFNVSVNQAFERVVEGCRRQHGTHCWLYPPLVESFRTMHRQSFSENDNVATIPPLGVGSSSSSAEACPVRLYSIEVWNASNNQLVGGELGYTVGSIYTSLTGFSSEDSAGSVQLAALGRLLCQNGFSLWDLGMDMEYKRDLGSQLMPRAEFVRLVGDVRHRHGHMRLPISNEAVNAKTVIDRDRLVSMNDA